MMDWEPNTQGVALGYITLPLRCEGDKTVLKIVFSLILCLLFTGCSSKYVIVKDEIGIPIQNAEVYAVYLSIASGPNLTNKKGIAKVPYIIQQIQWISISKEGYIGVWFEVPKTNKIQVVLKKEINTESDWLYDPLFPPSRE